MAVQITKLYGEQCDDSSLSGSWIAPSSTMKGSQWEQLFQANTSLNFLQKTLSKKEAHYWLEDNTVEYSAINGISASKPPAKA